MSKHTPGPWKKIGGMLVGADRTDVVAAGLGLGLGADSGDGVRTANAKLIASAPDLLEALEHAVDWLNAAGIAETMPVQLQARAAIKKATE